MARPLLAAVAVATLVVTAGCGSVLQDRTPPPSRDPYDVPTSAPERTVGEDVGTVAPGIEPDRVNDPGKLAAAHRRALSNRSFDLHYNYVVYAANGSITRGVNVRAEVDRNRTRFLVAVDDVTDDLGIAEAHDDERYYAAGHDVAALRAIHDGDSVTYSVVDSSTAGPVRVDQILGTDPTHTDRLLELLETVETVEVTPSRDPVPGSESGLDTFLVRVTNVSSDASIANLGRDGSVSNVSMVFLLREDGLLKEVYVSYLTRVGGERVRVVEQFRFLRVGDVRIHEPVWYEDALRETTARNGSTRGA